MYSGVYFIEDTFNSYVSMCYLFLFDVVAKDIHGVIKRGFSFFVLRGVDCIAFLS